MPWRILNTLGLDPLSGSKVNFVTENANWSIRWDGQYITEGVNRHHPGMAGVTSKPHRLLNRVVHFGSQYMWGAWAEHLSNSNRYAVTYFHGKPEDGPVAAKNLEDILKSIPKLDFVITASRKMETQLCSWGVPQEMLVRIPIGVDTNVFHPPTTDTRRVAREKLGISDDKICIGSFQKDGTGWGSGMEPKYIKGPDVFLNLIAQLKTELPLHVLLTGPARGYVCQGLERLGVSYQHAFLENYLDIVSYYHALDLYAVTSREEGGPKAILESMATGVPIISTNTGMAPDVIRDGENGGLAPVEDVAALAERCLHIATNPSVANSMRQNALETIALYDWAHIADMHHDNVYAPMLSRLEV